MRLVARVEDALPLVERLRAEEVRRGVKMVGAALYLRGALACMTPRARSSPRARMGTHLPC